MPLRRMVVGRFGATQGMSFEATQRLQLQYVRLPCPRGAAPLFVLQVHAYHFLEHEHSARLAIREASPGHPFALGPPQLLQEATHTGS